MKLTDPDPGKTYTYADYLRWTFGETVELIRGVPEYWMVFPREQDVLVCSLNEAGKYVGLPPFVKGDTISPVLFPGLVIDLADIFPEMDLAEEPWADNYIRM